MKVAAVVVTRDRLDVLLRGLSAVHAQSRQPDMVFVVDNGSSDGTALELQRLGTVSVIETGDNLGYAAALAVGMSAARTEGVDACWLLDDDSVPTADALARLTTVLASRPNAGLIGLRGGLLTRGSIKHLDAIATSRRPSPLPGVHQVDFVLVDGALASRAAVERAGLPRADFFMMLEDIEYSWRVGQAGLEVLTLSSELIERGHLGSVGASTNHWRSYYQSRNHVRWALDSGDWMVRLGCVRRQALFLAACAADPRRRVRKAKAHLLGIVDGFRGRMGRTVEPGSL